MISIYGTIIKHFATTRGTTLLRNPAFVSRNINDLQLTPTPQLLKISQKGKHPEQGRHDENASITILNVGRMNDGVEQEA
jgi:hypothetical protein